VSFAFCNAALGSPAEHPPLVAAESASGKETIPNLGSQAFFKFDLAKSGKHDFFEFLNL